MSDSAENALLKNALRLYAGDQVLNRVLSLGEMALERGGDRIEATVFFIGIVSSSPPLAELDSSTSSRLLDQYLETVMSSVADCGGIVDSLIGGDVSAYWLGEDQATNACGCAIKLLGELVNLNATYEETGFPQIRVRIGINTGAVTLGNYGTSYRLKYTVLGATVNLASRLCGLANSYYKFPIVISEQTKAGLSPSFRPVEIEAVEVKGWPEPVKLYGL